MNTPGESIIQGEIGKDLDARLSPLIQNAVLIHELPGFAIGIVANNDIVYAKGFGVQSVETRVPTTMKTLFHMASVSKPFVATALVQLIEKGRIQLDAPVITYLPYFKLDDERYRDITIQQMLSHVSGMPDEPDYEWEKPQYDEGALERYVRSLASLKLITPPGEKYAYSNIAFECLGDVIAEVSGMPFDDYVKEYILNPAGMTESTFLKPEHLPGNWAAPHLSSLASTAWKEYPYNRMHGPSSTLHSNALEMCNWAITNLNEGNFNGRHILKPSSYDLLWKPWAETIGETQPESPIQKHHVGLSWFLGEYRGEKVIAHSGGDTGFRTNFILLPDRKAAVVVLCNLYPSPVEQIAYSALDTLFGHKPAPLLPSASVSVLKTLRDEGLDAAVKHWNFIKSNHPNEYDYNNLTLSDALGGAVILDRVNEAEQIAGLCVQVLPESELKMIEDALRENPYPAAPIVLRTLHEHRGGA